MKLLLDEMYPATLAHHLGSRGIDTTTVVEAALDSAADLQVLEAAAQSGRTLLTENVSDFMRLASRWAAGGRHHAGVLIALSSRFSRRPAGLVALADAVAALAGETLDDRIVFLEAR